MSETLTPQEVTVEHQLETLAACGITMSPDAPLDDLFINNTREEMESEPYYHLLLALGEQCRTTLEPFCPSLWYLDLLCIEYHSAYVGILKRLSHMSGNSPAIECIEDFVQMDVGRMWLEFEVDENPIRWNINVDRNRLDPTFLVKFDKLLETHTDLRLYAHRREEFGPKGLLACFNEEQLETFNTLSKLKMTCVEHPGDLYS
jgi:hypothetical protein